MINLFDKRINGFLTKMDDSTSMVSLALRDTLESSGRTYMEYKRDTHGGRERLIEEGATMVIWGFGINWMKKLYDYLAKDVLKAIALPDMDIALLKKTEAPPAHQSKIKTFFHPPSAQSLVERNGQLKHNIKAFTEVVHQSTGQRVYDNLLEVIENQGKKALYNRSNLLKFGFATIMPVLGIAIGIPTFNQWFTQKKLDKAAQTKHKQTPQLFQQWAPRKSTSLGFSRNPAAATTPYPVEPMTTAGAFPPPFPTALTAGGQQPSGMPMNPSARNPFGLASTAGHSSQLNATGNSAVRFGGLIDAPGNLAAALLQNERMNTLLVDQTISGGRIVKARNWQERAEIAFREITIIGCLYWGQQALQNLFINKLGKNSHSQLSFDASKHLRDKFLLPNGAATAQHFADQYGEHLDNLAQAMKLKNRKQLLETLQKAHTPQLQYDLDQKLTQAVLEHFNPTNRNTLIANNLFLDLAKECHWIPTFDGSQPTSPKMFERFKNSLASLGGSVKNNLRTLVSKEADHYIPKAGQFLDLTKKINTEAMLGFIKSMEQAMLAEGVEKTPQKLEQLLQKSIRGRGLAWLGSNLVCTLFLSYVIPKAQHYMTYRMTGKHYFPGVEQKA